MLQPVFLLRYVCPQGTNNTVLLSAIREGISGVNVDAMKAVSTGCINALQSRESKSEVKGETSTKRENDLGKVHQKQKSFL